MQSCFDYGVERVNWFNEDLEICDAHQSNNARIFELFRGGSSFFGYNTNGGLLQTLVMHTLSFKRGLL
jgi:hypothetical protein